MDQNNASAEPNPVPIKPQAPARSRWQAIIEEHRESGLGVAAFCRQKAIATSSFYGWRLKLCGLAGSSLAKSDRQGRSAFVPVKVTAAGANGPELTSASPASQRDEPLELCLPGGRRLLLRSGFDPALLRQAVLVLESLASGQQEPA
jgi:hypothetical protein